MTSHRYAPHLAILAILAVTSVALVYGVNVRVIDDMAVKPALPDRVGDWRGEDVFYCPRESCQRSFYASQLTASHVCAGCGGELRKTWSLAESRALPSDTVLLKKAYAHPSGDRLTVSVVVNGKERGSIHRPEMCLVAQGSEITNQTVLTVPLAHREPLHVMELSAVRRFRVPDGTLIEQPAYYVYWFLAPGRETHDHRTRMAYSFLDQVVFSRVNRWAYIGISGTPRSHEDPHPGLIAFLTDFYPLVVEP